MPDLGPIAREFRVEGEFAGAESIGSGHIHDSYRVVFNSGAGSRPFVLQRMNTAIFTRPAELMQNMQRVTRHLARQVQGMPGAERRALTLVDTRDGRCSYVDDAGGWWRIFPLIEGAKALDEVTVAQAWQVAHAVGEFQVQMASLPEPRLHDTIPNFHNTGMRFEALERAVAADVAGRVANVSAELEFAMAHRDVCTLLTRADLPQRVVHNDAKSNNVLLDEKTGAALCMIDLDTVMPGLAAHDFGDMMRSMTSPSPEDERDLSQVYLQFDYYEALLNGYLAAAGTMLTVQEKRLLPQGGKVITFENGVRFLSDYLAGDTYYKIKYAGHNLDRCRAHFKLVESIEQQESAMVAAVERLI